MYVEHLLSVLWTSHLCVATLRTYIMCISLSRDTISSVCGSHQDFRERGLLLTTINKEDIEPMVPDMIYRHGIFVSQMTTDVLHLSRWQSYHTFLFYKLSPDVNKSNITGGKWSRRCFPLRSNWVRTQFLMGFLLLTLQFSAAKSLILSVMFFLLLDVF